jgi:hypothetical protein
MDRVMEVSFIEETEGSVLEAWDWGQQRILRHAEN